MEVHGVGFLLLLLILAILYNIAECWVSFPGHQKLASNASVVNDTRIRLDIFNNLLLCYEFCSYLVEMLFFYVDFLVYLDRIGFLSKHIHFCNWVLHECCCRHLYLDSLLSKCFWHWDNLLHFFFFLLPLSPLELWFIELSSNSWQQITKYAPDKKCAILPGQKAISSEHVECQWSGSVRAFPWQMSLSSLAATPLKLWSWAKYEGCISLLKLFTGDYHSFAYICVTGIKENVTYVEYEAQQGWSSQYFLCVHVHFSSNAGTWTCETHV